MRLPLLACLIATLPLAAQIPQDGRGWGRFRLGADYDALKQALAKEGWKVSYRSNRTKEEQTPMGRRFVATPTRKDTVREAQVIEDEGQVVDLVLELRGADPEAVRAALTQALGSPDSPAEGNFRWRAPGVAVSGFFHRGGMSLSFSVMRE